MQRALFIFLLLYSLALSTGCAASQGKAMYFQSFSFNAISDAAVYGHPEVEILDFAYGGSGLPGTARTKAEREMGDFTYQHGVGGMLPRPDFLYVKWRIKATGVVREERVDLEKRLPADMTNFAVHFLISKEQLYVFLIPPSNVVDVSGNGTTVPGGWTRDIFYSPEYAQYRREHQIYPDPAK